MFNGFSLNSIQSAYIGSTPISSIYYGSQKIYPSTPPTPIPYERQYLTFEASEPTTFSFSTNDLQYSLDDGQSWTTLTTGHNTPQLAAGEKILWKQTGLTPTSSYGIGTFSSTGNFIAYGNVMSLYYGDNFHSQYDLTGKSYAFYRLFTGSNILNAENLILPATTLVSACYQIMFSSCTKLQYAPVLPATALAMYCYRAMFQGCTALTTAPQLPAPILVDYCYEIMFYHCTQLNYVKCLATNTSNLSNYTANWLRDVPQTGTFVKDSHTTWPVNFAGVPSGWTIRDA